MIDQDVIGSRHRVVAAITQAAESNIPVVKPTLNPLCKSVPFWTKEFTEAVQKQNKAKNTTDEGLKRPTALLPAKGRRTANDQDGTAANILAGLQLDFEQQF